MLFIITKMKTQQSKRSFDGGGGLRWQNRTLQHLSFHRDVNAKSYPYVKLFIRGGKKRVRGYSTGVALKQEDM